MLAHYFGNFALLSSVYCLEDATLYFFSFRCTMIADLVFIFCLTLLSCLSEASVPKFEPVSVTDQSLVIKLINGEVVSHLDMAVHIFDLTNLEEFRKLEFKSNDRDEVNTCRGRDMKLINTCCSCSPSMASLVILGSSSEYTIEFCFTMQQRTERKTSSLNRHELVVHTKPEGSRLSPTKIEDIVASVEETFTTKQNLYVSVKSVFSDSKNIMTVVVPELRCPGRGIVKPLAQQIKERHARFHFDITSLGEEIDLFECKTVCFFPFLRVQMKNRTSETFRAREWCGSITRVIEIGTPNTATSHSVALFLSLVAVPLLL
ncbi:hypothetical protein PRIPAC_79580 [Pristionchus pacificus]|uniref:Uncharacterized protein n=1 Tax=Pristionchus pacificus TaxID=54126 RepID=A0A2A6CP32_PRIPA|nr:hypothetical protein PRIPAC_79580 [Pristionchus pacificus]|eukprot:PDM79813.1 hypothetical protein PRIPAC_32392 [Pristionchus pacificus]